jgi:hypothetical protein
MSLPIKCRSAESYCGRVVDERIEPDIHDALRIERKRDSPGLAGPADRNIIEAALEQSKLLVTADFGLKEIRVRREQIEQRLLILGQPEEVVLLLNPLHFRRRVQRTTAVDELFFRLERLAANTVPALVNTLVNVPPVINALNHF